MRKIVASAAVAASAAATLLAFPVASQASITPNGAVPTVTLCANTTPGNAGAGAGAGQPAGAPVFFRVIPEDGTKTTINIGVQDGFCQPVFLIGSATPAAPVRLKVQRMGSSASHQYCGPMDEMQCQSPQFPYNEMSWFDSFSSGRDRTNVVEVVSTGDGSAFVADWTNSAW